MWVKRKRRREEEEVGPIELLLVVHLPDVPLQPVRLVTELVSASLTKMRKKRINDEDAAAGYDLGEGLVAGGAGVERPALREGVGGGGLPPLPGQEPPQQPGAPLLHLAAEVTSSEG